MTQLTLPFEDKYRRPCRRRISKQTIWGSRHRSPPASRPERRRRRFASRRFLPGTSHTRRAGASSSSPDQRPIPRHQSYMRIVMTSTGNKTGGPWYRCGADPWSFPRASECTDRVLALQGSSTPCVDRWAKCIAPGPRPITLVISRILHQHQGQSRARSRGQPAKDGRKPRHKSRDEERL